jgi:hypothetical protein
VGSVLAGTSAGAGQVHHAAGRLRIFVFDYLCERYGAWSGTTALPFRFPGGVSLEEITWIALFVPLVLVTPGPSNQAAPPTPESEGTPERPQRQRRLTTVLPTA